MSKKGKKPLWYFYKCFKVMIESAISLIQEAWHRLQGWYKAAVDRAPPPARATLKRVTAERAKL